jgi:hypothetical protein
MLRTGKSKQLFISLLSLAIFLTASTISAQCLRPGFKLVYGQFNHAAYQIIARDFNGDNKSDIASISYNGTLLISLGDGLGGFTSQTVYQGQTGFYKIYSADINGDGKLDLIPGAGGGGFATWLNNGSGGFSYLANYGHSWFGEPQFMDFNGDAKADMLAYYAVDQSYVFQVRFGDGVGGFTNPVNYPANNLQSFAAGDFNGDGKKDIATLTNNAPPHGLTIYLNDGAGVFSPGPTVNLNTHTHIEQVTDFNGDGKTDIVATSQDNTVSILLNNGSGGFTRSDYPMMASVNSIRLADFNGDGKLDVFAGLYETPNPTVNASILFSDGLGGFTRNDFLSSVSISWTAYGDAADFNGDNMADIVSLGSETGLRIWNRTCNQNGNTRRVDYTGDGIGDFALWRPSNGNWTILTGGISYRTVQWGLGSLGDIPVPGDYDGDGISDVAVFRAPSGDWYILRSSDGNGFGVHWGANGDKPAPGDYDADGKTDFAVFRPSDGGWYILKSSDGTMASYAFGMQGDKPVQFDFDGDDKTDVAVFRPSNGFWYILRSSDGNYTGQHFGQNGDIPVPGDYDGDSKADLAVYRLNVGLYYLKSWNNLQVGIPHNNYFGTSSAADRPAPLFNHDLITINVWRPANGFFGGLSDFHSGIFGTTGDIPVTAPYVIE